MGRRSVRSPIAGAQTRAGPVCNPLRNDRQALRGGVHRPKPRRPPGIADFSAAPQCRTCSVDRKPRGQRSIAPPSRHSSMHCRLTTLSSRRPLPLKRSADMSNCMAFFCDSNCIECGLNSIRQLFVPSIPSMSNRSAAGTRPTRVARDEYGPPESILFGQHAETNRPRRKPALPNPIIANDSLPHRTARLNKADHPTAAGKRSTWIISDHRQGHRRRRCESYARHDRKKPNNGKRKVAVLLRLPFAATQRCRVKNIRRPAALASLRAGGRYPPAERPGTAARPKARPDRRATD